jgi:hypothetical protein
MGARPPSPALLLIPGERFGANLSDAFRIGDVLIGQAGAAVRPCGVELRLRMIEIAARRCLAACRADRSRRKIGTACSTEGTPVFIYSGFKGNI